MRRIDDTACEMKRMFVYPQLHGQGIGRALAHAVIEKGRVLGYHRMVLDTSVRQREAQTLYQQCGFTRTEPYYELPADVREWLVFMELALAP